jgi:uncharacterized protein (DUF58 family)
MRLQAFTPRALGFAAAAAALYLAGRLTGVPELYMLAVASLALPAGALVVVTWGNYRLACGRTVRPLRTSVGNRIQVALRVDNPARLETGVLLLEDRLPYQLGPGARFVVPGIPGGDREVLHYDLRAAARGRYTIGPLAVRLSDPFGLAQVTSELAGTTDVIVHPRVESLTAPGLGGELASSAATRIRYLFTQGDEFYTTREYRDGDDLRKVHWRSSAKRGQLMIRQEERPWQARALLAVDLRRDAHRGQGGRASFERAVSAVASIAVRLAASGYELALVTDDGRQAHPAGAGDQATAILDFLASVEPTPGRSLVPLAERLSHSAGEGLLVAVLAVPNADEAGALARCRLAFGGALGLLLRTDSWLGLAGRETAAADAQAAGIAGLLQRAGWRSAMLTRTQPLDEPWRRLTAPLARATPITHRR